MLRSVMIATTLFFFLGCSQNSMNISSSNISNELLKQKEASDKEVQKLEEEIAKLESDKQKYRQDYENFDNNAILDELDETLKDDEVSNELGKEVR